MMTNQYDKFKAIKCMVNKYEVDDDKVLHKKNLNI